MHVHKCLCVCAHIHTSGDQRTVLWSFVSVCVVLSTHVCGIVPGIELRLSGLPSKRLYVLNHLTGPSTTSLNPILFLWLSLFRAVSQFWLFNPSTCFTGTAFCPSTFRCPAVIIVFFFFFSSFKQRANSCFSSIPRVGELLTQHSHGRTASLPVFFEIKTVYTRVPRIWHLIMIILWWRLQITCAVSH